MAGAPGFQAWEIVVNLFQVAGDFGLVGAGVAAGEQVFFDGQVGKAVAPFHDLHHAALDQVGGREVLNFLAFQHDAAFGDLAALAFEQVGDGPQSGGLARTIAAEQGNDAMLWHFQRNAFEYQDDVVVNDFNAIDFDQRLGCGSGGCSAHTIT